MAAENGPASDHLTYLRRAEESLKRYGFLALLRGAEARAPHLPRISRARMPAQNVVDLAHAASMDFPASTIDGIEFGRGGRARVRSNFLGLTGPMGALPLHLTEFAHYELRYAKTHPFGRFLDLLTDRFLQFFYRAWADSQPAAQADRPADDRFAGYLAALSGAGEGAGSDVGFSALERLRYVGLFTSRRSASVVQDALADLLRAPVRIREFVPVWREVERSDRTRLTAIGGFNQLGRDMILGGRVRLAEDRFRVIVSTRNFAEYESFLPGGRMFRAAQEALDALAPSHLEWDLELEIPESQARGARLDGKARLGWTSWAAPQASLGVRADARLRRRVDINGAAGAVLRGGLGHG